MFNLGLGGDCGRWVGGWVIITVKLGGRDDDGGRERKGKEKRR